MDSFFAIISAILFQAAITILNDGSTYLMSQKGYSFSQMTIIFLLRTLSRLIISSNFHVIIRNVGIFRSIIVAITLFCEAIILLWWSKGILVFAISISCASLVSNFILIHMINSLRSSNWSVFTTSIISFGGIISSFIFPLELTKKIFIVISFSLFSVLFFVFRDSHKIQNEWFDKGKPRILTLFFKYESYFWTSFFYNMANILIARYLILILNSIFSSRLDIAKGIFFLYFGRFCLNYPIKRLLQKSSIKIKIFIVSFGIITTSYIIFNSLSHPIFIYFAIFIIGALTGTKSFIIEYFNTIKLRQDHYNISIILTEQQMESMTNLVSIIVGLVISYLSIAKGVLITIIALHVGIILLLLF